MDFRRNIIITGGAGFIGSHVVRLFVNKYPDYHIINLDNLTYAGNLTNLKDIENKPNYTFVKADICDFEMMLKIFKQYHIDGVIHLAAESHVDRSIRDPFTLLVRIFFELQRDQSRPTRLRKQVVITLYALFTILIVCRLLWLDNQERMDTITSGAYESYYEGIYKSK